VGIANAATLTTASMALSDPRPSQTGVTYTFTGSSVTLSAINCIKEQFATTATGNTVPTNFDSTGAAFSGTSTYVPTPASWTTTATSNGTVKLTYSTGETPASASSRTVVLTGITNSSVQDTAYYVRINTYSNTDCATGPVDSATVEFINTNGSTLSLTVDNSLSFTVTGVNSGGSCNGATSNGTSTATTIPFGTLTYATNGIVCQDLNAATNATNGFTIYIRDTAQLANSLSQTIADWSGTNSAPTTWTGSGATSNTEGYAYTTSDATLTNVGNGVDRFTNGGPKWAAFLHGASSNNKEVAYEAAGVQSTTYHLGFQAGVSAVTHPGTYNTTVLYTCTPVY
jgi:hypothetical protein